MTYTELLNEIISKANLTQYAVWKGCADLGVPMDRSLINKLCNEPARRGSDEINRAICKVCNVPEHWLSTQAQLDRDTEIIKKTYSNFFQAITFACNMLLNPKKSPEISAKIDEALATFRKVEIIEEASKVDMSKIEEAFQKVDMLQLAGARNQKQLLKMIETMLQAK